MNKQIVDKWTYGGVVFSLYSLAGSRSSREFVLECTHYDSRSFPAQDISKAKIYAQSLIQNDILPKMTKEGIITTVALNRVVEK
ncbi:hypothetical protein [Okeania sp. KiyG1]|uniref:hypothetical protein n=1 Tax=Okeania sp. KiyG1 TaxID=2720165 RepID=UPI0019207FE8|nr:hypothetical protein [Okeania sp. KiyG1]